MLLHRAPEPLCHRIRERAASAARVRSAGCACRDCAILLPPTPRSWPSSPSIGVCLANCSACEPSHEASRTTSRGGNGSGADQGRRVVGVVRGTEVYETSVHLGEDETLDSECTCPAGRLCKHAVAIVFAILDACAAGEDLPVAGPASPAPKPSRRSSRASRDEPGREEVHDWLRAQPKHELVAPPGPPRRSHYPSVQPHESGVHRPAFGRFDSTGSRKSRAARCTSSRVGHARSSADAIAR